VAAAHAESGAASVWPSLTERMPARTISAMYAASFSESPMTAATKNVITSVVWKLGELGPERDAEPELRVEHADQAPEDELGVDRRAAEHPQVDPGDRGQNGFGESRITASTTPSATPSAIATTVSSSVTSAPRDSRWSNSTSDGAPAVGVVGDDAVDQHRHQHAEHRDADPAPGDAGRAPP
jgi:hypothetical protein